VKNNLLNINNKFSQKLIKDDAENSGELPEDAHRPLRKYKTRYIANFILIFF